MKEFYKLERELADYGYLLMVAKRITMNDSSGPPDWDGIIILDRRESQVSADGMKVQYFAKLEHMSNWLSSLRTS